MKRRAFIAGLSSAAAWPLVARAQSERVRRIGVLAGVDEPDNPTNSAGGAEFAAIRAVAQPLKVEVTPVESRTDDN
jgi:putative ABC transport system substrate-binding protein